ncbi:sel1 repeat family protein [Porticoccaceae bacterium]|nr:sel1 repeat family protein [Porticoccaceae bacterium]
MRYILLLTVVLASNAFAAPDFDETMAEANQGAAYAQFNLGNMYDNGEGVPENDAEAVKWFRKAADQGLAVAQFNLGNMYFNGDGVPESNIRAYVWWSMAKTQGDADAAVNIDILKPQMTKQQIAQAQAQALASQCYESDYKDCD